jgi:sphingomyelin phosphodiesterase acid-like 3
MKYLRKTHAKFLLTLTTIGLTILLVMPLGCGKKTEQPTPPAAVAPPPADETIGNVPHISDIHFNPFYDTTLLPQLIAAEVNQWESIFETSKIKGFGTVSKNETNYILLVSSLKDMVSTSKNPDFIIFTGDFLAHEFPDKFKNHAPEGRDYDTFVEKTIEFVVLMFEKYFPDIPVYISLGNNDCYAGDYQVIPEGKFLKNTTPVLADKFLENPGNRGSFAETYPVGGYFTVAPAGTENTLIISLNSNFFSPKHKNTVDYDPGKRELDWFEKQLVFAQQKKQKAWLLLHIPPGTNVYTTVHKNQYTSMWKQEYNDRFISLVKTYAPVIIAGFCGHTHMDDFRVLVDPQTSQAISFVRISPAISPQFGNNPGYLQMSYDRQEFSLKNYVLYYLNLEITNPNWGKEYAFTEVYGQTAITAATLLAVYNAINTDPAVRKSYMDYFNVSDRPHPSLTDANWKAYWCGIGNWTQTSFESCNSTD